jgi:hypothetical protein
MMYEACQGIIIKIFFMDNRDSFQTAALVLKHLIGQEYFTENHTTSLLANAITTFNLQDLMFS